MTEFELIIIDLVNETPGIKRVTLIAESISTAYKENKDAITGDVPSIINQLVNQGDIIEIEYVLPYRIKSLYFPKGTEITVISPNKKDQIMIFHLAAAGTPTSWFITAIYSKSYGVACCSAETWYNTMLEDKVNDFSTYPDRQPDSPQFVIELEQVDHSEPGEDLDVSDYHWKVVRSHLLMNTKYYKTHQQYDRSSYLIQHQATSPFPLEESLIAALTNALREKLVEVNYFIPRKEWEQKYPEQVEYIRQFRKMMNGNNNEAG